MSCKICTDLENMVNLDCLDLVVDDKKLKLALINSPKKESIFAFFTVAIMHIHQEI